MGWDLFQFLPDPFSSIWESIPKAKVNMEESILVAFDCIWQGWVADFSLRWDLQTMDHLVRRSDTLTQKESKDMAGGVSISQWAEIVYQTPMEIPLESPPATLPSQNKFHWEGKPLGNLTRLDQRQLLKMESSGTFAAISFPRLLLSGRNEDSRQTWEARRTKGKVGIVSGTDGCPWLPCALLAASSAPLPAGGIICGEGWKGTHVSGHCPGQMEGGLRTRREPCMAGRVATIPLGSKETWIEGRQEGWSPRHIFPNGHLAHHHEKPTLCSLRTEISGVASS